MNIIVCVDEKNGIGKDGKLLYSIPDDMKHFVDITKGNTVIMGRKTLYSFKNKAPLKNRINIVFTKDKKILEEEYKEKGFDNIFFVDSLDMINAILSKNSIDDKKVFVIGGESIYKMLIDKCDTLYITKMYKTFSADTFFPDYEMMGYKRIEEDDIREYDNVKYQFITYKK